MAKVHVNRFYDKKRRIRCIAAVCIVMLIVVFEGFAMLMENYHDGEITYTYMTPIRISAGLFKVNARSACIYRRSPGLFNPRCGQMVVGANRNIWDWNSHMCNIDMTEQPAEKILFIAANPSRYWRVGLQHGTALGADAALGGLGVNPKTNTNLAAPPGSVAVGTEVALVGHATDSHGDKDYEAYLKHKAKLGGKGEKHKAKLGGKGEDAEHDAKWYQGWFNPKEMAVGTASLAKGLTSASPMTTLNQNISPQSRGAIVCRNATLFTYVSLALAGSLLVSMVSHLLCICFLVMFMRGPTKRLRRWILASGFAPPVILIICLPIYSLLGGDFTPKEYPIQPFVTDVGRPSRAGGYWVAVGSALAAALCAGLLSSLISSVFYGSVETKLEHYVVHYDPDAGYDDPESLLLQYSDGMVETRASEDFDLCAQRQEDAVAGEVDRILGGERNY